MNKADLIEHVAAAVELPRSQAEKAVNAVLAGIQAGVKKDKTCQLVGFGTFRLKMLKSREVRNPQTGETMKTKPSKTVGFKPGVAFKTSL